MAKTCMRMMEGRTGWRVDRRGDETLRCRLFCVGDERESYDSWVRGCIQRELGAGEREEQAGMRPWSR